MADALRIGPRSLILPARFYAPFGLTLDWSHPLAHRLQSFCVPDGMGGVVDLVKPRGGTGGTRGLRNKGPTSTGAWSIAAANTTDVDFTAAPFTVAAHGFLSAVPAGLSGLFSRASYTSESVNTGWTMFARSTAFSWTLFNNNNSNGYQTLGSNSIIAVGDWSMSMSSDGTNKPCYLNGTTASLAATGTGRSCASNTTVGIQSSSGGPGVAWTNEFEMYVGATWTRVLTDAEHLAFHFDPFCMVRSIIPDTAPFKAAEPSGSVAQTLRVLQQTIAGAVSPGGQVAQTLSKISQVVTGSNLAAGNDEFFSWRTD